MARRQPYTINSAYEAVARSLREFGYPHASAEMVRDTHAAMKAGAAEMPHGIVGMFAESQLKEAGEALDRLPK